MLGAARRGGEGRGAGRGVGGCVLLFGGSRGFNVQRSTAFGRRRAVIAAAAAAVRVVDTD